MCVTCFRPPFYAFTSRPFSPWHVASLVAPVDELYFPSPQSTHVASLVAPVEVLYFPSPQSSHVETPVDVLNVPAGQGEQEEEAAPEYSPVPQKEQVDSLEAPVDELNFPAAQSEQAGAPVEELNFPAAQSEQEVAPTALNVPAEQGPSQSELEAPPDGL
jgi:hypothetical protein